MPDSAEFEKLVERLYAPLYQFAFSLTRVEADACDCTLQSQATTHLSLISESDLVRIRDRYCVQMENALELGRELLRKVNCAGKSYLDVAGLHALHERRVMVRPPHGFDHRTAIDAGELRYVQYLVAIVRIGEKCHLQRVSGAMKETGAGAGKIARIGARNRGHALMHGVLNQIAAIAAAKTTNEAPGAAIPRARIGDGLQVGGRRKGLNVNRSRSAVFIHPTLPALRAIQRLVCAGIKGAMHGKRLGRVQTRRQKKRKEDKGSSQDHIFIFNEGSRISRLRRRIRGNKVTQEVQIAQRVQNGPPT